MSTAQNLVCLSDSLDKIHQMLQENPQDALRLFEEHPDLVPRIQELVFLLERLEPATQSVSYSHLS